MCLEHVSQNWGKLTRNNTKEDSLSRILQSFRPQPLKHGVSHDRDTQERQKEEDIKTKDDDRDPVQPSTVVGQVVKQNRRDARAHGDSKPRRRKAEHDTAPSPVIDDALISAEVPRDRRRRPGVCNLAGIRVQVEPRSSHDNKQISPDLNKN